MLKPEDIIIPTLDQNKLKDIEKFIDEHLIAQFKFRNYADVSKSVSSEERYMEEALKPYQQAGWCIKIMKYSVIFAKSFRDMPKNNA